MLDIEFLYKYTNANAPSGHEDEGQKIWTDFITQYVDKVETDSFANVVGIINPNAGYSVAIEAHADEISYAVSYIAKDGYIYVDRNGGADYDVAPATRVLVHLDDGTKITGIFGWPAIHVRKPKDSKSPDHKSIILDLGCSSDEEVKRLGIHIGTMVTQDASTIELNNGKYYVGRAYDNRMGGVIIAHVAKKLYEEKQKLPFTLYVCNCVQEEVGLRGASITANRLKPNIAIVTDVTHDTQSPHYDKVELGDISCGKGPVVAYAPSINRPLRKLIVDTAKRKEINIQEDFCGRSTGTDTDAFAYCQSGIPSALISLPLKYMHTPVEMVSSKDIDDVINLIYNTLLSISPNFKVKPLDE